MLINLTLACPSIQGPEVEDVNQPGKAYRETNGIACMKEIRL